MTEKPENSAGLKGPGSNAFPSPSWGPSRAPSWLLSALCVAFIAAMSAYFFRGVFDPVHTIDGLDSSLWVPMSVHSWTEGLFIPRWATHYFAGVSQQVYFLSHGLPLMLTASPHRFHGLQFMIDSFLAGAFMFAFLRDRKLGRFGALVGGLSYQLGNNLLTAASLGGMWKFATVCWVPLFLLFFIRVTEDAPNRLRNSVFAGATLGLQFLGGEVQLSYYVGLLAAAYFAFDSADRLLGPHRGAPSETASNVQETRGVGDEARRIPKRILWGALCAAFAVIFAAEVFCNYASFTQASKNVGVRTEKENWEFVTQFSFPPRETVALALTGKAFDTDEYPLKYKGAPIARIADDYLGIIVLAFAFMALFSGNRKVWFFAAAAAAALLIAYGRFFPFPFKLIYELPMMKGLRNPHKWLFIMALCIPILAGIGADFWRKAPPSKNRRILLSTIIFFCLMSALALLSPAITGSASGSITPAVYGRLALLFAASLIFILARTEKAAASKGLLLFLPLLLIAMLAGDLVQNASRFIKYYDHRERYIEDELTQWMTSRPGQFRVKLWAQNPRLTHFMTEVLSYHDIGTPDVIASRRPARYSDIFGALREGRLPLEKFLHIFNVKYIVSSAAIARTAAGPDLPLDLVATFNPRPDGPYAGGALVYELDGFLPRAYVVRDFEVSGPESVIDNIARPGLDLHSTVVLEEHPGPGVLKRPDNESRDESNDDSGGGADKEDWSVSGFFASPHETKMLVNTGQTGILVLQDLYHPGWRASVDGSEVEIMRANYLMRAVALPAGEHEVIFTYEPPRWGFNVTLASWALTLLLVAFMAARKLLGESGGGSGDK